MKKTILLIIVLLLVGCNSTAELDELELKVSELEVEVEVLKASEASYKMSLEDMENALSESKEALKETTMQLDEALALAESEEEEIMITATLLDTALDVMTLIDAGDFLGVSTYVDATEGLRFSPYSYIDFGSDLLFTPLQVSNFSTDVTIYTWGNYDGSGDPISLDFSNYYNEFIYDHSYLSPHMIGNNVIIGTGNMINNLVSTYTGASFVEFHFTGFNPAYSGMDWSSLRLIFKNIGGTWKLIGIQHDQWTT
jgi:outer membrane murein-binding lipoprotein Lpp